MHVYFVGVGGSGISSLAQLALDCGFDVSGSDRESSLGTEAVENRGVKISYNQDGESLKRLHKLKQVDWVVYSAACRPHHPELEFARKNNIKLTKRDGFINYVLQEKKLKLLAIAGTHGKTTTTAMVVWAFEQLGVPISYLIGSNISFGPSAAYQEGSEYFALEADEFDRHFLQYNPELSVATNIDFDHSDVYIDKEDYNAAFSKFFDQSNHSFVWDEDSLKIANSSNSIQILSKDISLDGFRLIGSHNRQNAYMVYKLLSEIGRAPDRVLEVLNTFPGTQRRMEKLGERLFTDYAHHPTEIKASLQMLREQYMDVVVVYQPHQNVRQHEIQDKYKDCFEQADRVFWLPTYFSRENESLEILSPQYLIRRIDNNEHIEESFMTYVLQHDLTKLWEAGKTIVFMGAGDIDNWARFVSKMIDYDKTINYLVIA